MVHVGDKPVTHRACVARAVPYVLMRQVPFGCDDLTPAFLAFLMGMTLAGRGFAESAGTAGGIAGVAILVIMFVFAVIYFFPLLFLVRFSRHTAKAVANLDGNELQTGLKYLKNYWKYIGILIIVILSFYLIALIFFGSTLALLKGLG